MTLDSDSDSWYYDGYARATSWTWGKEVWCNLEGRYMHLIANLSHLLESPYSFSSYRMALC